MAKSKWNIAKNGAPDNTRHPSDKISDLANAVKIIADRKEPPAQTVVDGGDGGQGLTWQQRRRNLGIRD